MNMQTFKFHDGNQFLLPYILIDVVKRNTEIDGKGPFNMSHKPSLKKLR